ncbi:MAG: hypothetical protein ABSD50_04330 [Smithella sp.]|jgi:hypothetical protein
MKGTVTQIKDNQDKELPLLSNAKGIKAGDKVFVNIYWIQLDNPRKLTVEGKDFLIKQCFVNPADLDIKYYE